VLATVWRYPPLPLLVKAHSQKNNLVFKIEVLSAQNSIIYNPNLSFFLALVNGLRSTDSKQHTATKYHAGANAQLEVPLVSEPPYTEAEANGLAHSENDVRRNRGHLLFDAINPGSIYFGGLKMLRKRTEESLFTPETQTSCEHRFSPSISQDAVAEVPLAESDRLWRPC
jgi:hypothetical protein